ncbi:MAG: gluconate 2-dehydrogenase subunit 3 family protein [Bacteroidota bacterium]
MAMDRRKYLKALAVGTLGTGAILQSCEPGKEQPAIAPLNYDRTPAEQAHYEKLMAERFFDDHEMKTIRILIDIIIPRDETSGSATDAGVHDFIEFIVKDKPEHQIPVRGGIKWLDLHCNRQFDKPFAELSAADQLAMVDQIAYPDQTKPGMEQGVAFFNKMRDLTACGFFTSEIGIKDLGYMGNRPNQWDGVPQEVLDQYGLKYDQRTLDESVKFES